MMKSSYAVKSLSNYVSALRLLYESYFRENTDVHASHHAAVDALQRSLGTFDIHPTNPGKDIGTGNSSVMDLNLENGNRVIVKINILVNMLK